jgi:PadR family transcriptional regulator, regulatory protein PadR
MAEQSTEFLKGTLDLMILKTLSWAPAHGYGIARWIEQCTDDVLQVEEGSLYPALQRLLKNGCVKARWEVSGSGRRVRTYEITRGGAKRLAREISSFEQLLEGIRLVLAPVEP